MNNKALLSFIAVILLGIFTVVLIEVLDKSPGEEIADSISNFSDNVSDEYSDTTTSLGKG